ncbi:NAD(P)-binding protein [Coniochaeta sp. PMI_546]|nr:NAD(P)-binding protein [Coniochaeta sp. PMI_546]
MATDIRNRSNLFSVAGLVAVITGGGSGLGRHMAHSLAANGARKVYILGRRLETLEQCASSSPSGSIVPIQCDITSKEDIEKAATRVADEIGHINLLVLSAGVPGPRSAVLPKNSSVDEFVADQWRISMDEYVEPFRTHDAASWFTAMGFLRLLDAGNRDDSVVQLSQIIIVSSAGAFNRATLGNFAYAQSKSGQIHMMKQLATVLVPYNIRANAICPGVFPSDLSEWTNKSGVLSSANFPAGRFGDEKDMAGVILFLASEAGGYVNGNVMLVDGGSIGTIPGTY